MESENILAKTIIGKSLEVHKALGPGLLESAYEECLSYELANSGLYIERQKALPIVYKEIKLEHGYRADIVVENKVIIEIKSVEALADIHIAQALTYLKFSKLRLALLLNFNVKLLKDGIRRLIM
ncbi:MAG: GxxExxY protein [Bacteroidetes bacterium]|nr:GxxExxY protein [Bacteroidota bacterium]MBT3933836.1 GxxExxY protein [Bacteroidota bacterium]MBT4337942.1 GxxExxY protein [Bacteroidota bacterium]MBT4730088.1 GxxExxY protein [Bacteroidota bacterium]MBT5989945.1 GxxExxY protein [Bacteroidota bacterium]